MDRETALEIGVGVFGVGAFIFSLLLVGTLFGDGALDEGGGFVLIGLICGFIFLMTGLGHWLSRVRD